jgi:hypothetical protein
VSSKDAVCNPIVVFVANLALLESCCLLWGLFFVLDVQGIQPIVTYLYCVAGN